MISWSGKYRRPLYFSPRGIYFLKSSIFLSYSVVSCYRKIAIYYYVTFRDNYSTDEVGVGPYEKPGSGTHPTRVPTRRKTILEILGVGWPVIKSLTIIIFEYSFRDPL